MKRLEVFQATSPGRDASPSQATPQQFCQVSPTIRRTHLYTWVERGRVGVKCLAQEHDTMSTSPARAQTQTARSGVERTNHEATTPPSKGNNNLFKNIQSLKKSVVKLLSMAE